MTLRGTRSGFTMVEMLVVIAIIVALVAILFPTFQTAREKANQTKCITQMHNLVMALQSYKKDYKRYPPKPIYDAGAGLYIGGFSALYPDYIDSWEAMVCPSDRDIDGVQDQAKDKRYCSYNGKAQDPANDDWDLEDSGYEGVTYNYYGYSNDGYDEYDVTTYEGAPTKSPLDPLPAWLDRGWRHYPRLLNRQAPDYTIVTHCVHHRDFYNNDQDQIDPLIRLGGDAGPINVAAMRTQTAGVSKFKSQE